MESNIESLLHYRGNVKLSLIINGKKVEIKKHNQGTSYFYSVFAKALLGQYDGNEIPKPRFLEVRCNDTTTWEEQEPGTPYTINPVGITAPTLKKTTTIGNSTGYAAVFTAVIRYDNLIAPVESTSAQLFRLYLSYNEQSDYLAWIDIDAVTLSLIEPGTLMVVEWQMQLIG